MEDNLANSDSDAQTMLFGDWEVRSENQVMYLAQNYV